MTKQEPAPVIEIPLTAEARMALLNSLFADDLPHLGELFVPDDLFYSEGGAHKRAKHMTEILCIWLGIKTGYIGLEFEDGGTVGAEGTRYTIYLEESVLADEFILGAFLAFTLTRYLLEERKQIYLPEPSAQASLLASASVMFGFGVVISNGISPAYNVISYMKTKHSPLLKGFPLSNYHYMTLNFLHLHRIPIQTISGSLTPWAVKRLNIAPKGRSIHAVKDARHRIKLANLKLLGTVWLVALIFSLGIFIALQRVHTRTGKSGEAQKNILKLQGLTKLCKDSLAYDRQYSDLSDIQTVRALNAQDLSCRSLNNQLESAQYEYDR